MVLLRLASFLTFCCFLAPAADPGWVKLFNNRNLDGWQVVGDGLWYVLSDGTLVGERDLENSHEQSWLYTTRDDFDEFDLRAVYWLRFDGNSGISIRDSSRARYAVPPAYDPKRTPSHIGYEIQLLNHGGDPFHTGSVYLFDHAKDGFLKEHDWNTIEIQARHSGIKVLLNGQLVSESTGDPARPLQGPIGIQLHDKTTVIMLKSIEIRSSPNRDR